MSSAHPVTERELENPGYELFILGLSILSLVNLAITVLPFETDVKDIALIIDVPISVIFLADFSMRLARSHPRRAYFIDDRGWLDLVGSFPLLRAARLFRVWKVSRMLRVTPPRQILKSFVSRRAESALLIVVFLVLVLLEFGSMFMVYAERGAENANIKGGGDAIWWAFVSVTTVGYGDRFPVTTLGRVVAVFLLAAGVGLFGVLTGYLANVFLTPPKHEPVESTSTPGATADLRRLVDDLEVSVAAIRLKLAQLEASDPGPATI